MQRIGCPAITGNARIERLKSSIFFEPCPERGRHTLRKKTAHADRWKGLFTIQVKRHFRKGYAMCKFLSGIVLRNGDVLTSEYTDSHDLIVESAGLRERNSPAEMGWVKVEYTSKTLLDIDTYKLTVDKTDVPAWFDGEMCEYVTAKMRRIATKCILDRGEITILLGGKWVIGGTVNVGKAVNSYIAYMYGGTLTEMYGGTLTQMHGGTLTYMHSGTLTRMYGGTLTYMHSGTLTRMDGGTLTRMYGGTLTEMYGGTLTQMDGGTIVKDFRTK